MLLPRGRARRKGVERLDVAGTSDHFTIEQVSVLATPDARSASSGNQLVKLVPCRLMSRKRPPSMSRRT
jgi:hypothetical protein